MNCSRSRVLSPPEEHQHIQNHPLLEAKILGGIDFFKDKILMVLHHHEHFDGTGYPEGLTGEDIPRDARIIALSDAFDTLTRPRPHRAKLTLDEALFQMKKGGGKQFDPDLLDLFLDEKLYAPPEGTPAEQDLVPSFFN